MKKSLAIAGLIICLESSGIGQTQNDTIFNYFAETPVTIDGQATEACWANAEWQSIDQVWMPYNANMAHGDFEGRFKVAWDASYFYILVEVLDDSLSDDDSNPLSNWWNDDCLEIFIDENRSKGDHERTCNAFAYHVSLFYDAIDLNSSGNGINYKNHVNVDMDTIGENLYLWEMAINIYGESYNHSNPEASRVTLAPDKKMGLAVAYCDNDETTTRENFIGSMYMTAANNNEMYRNADYFGLMQLVDPGISGVKKNRINDSRGIIVYPSPANDWLTVAVDHFSSGIKKLDIVSITGQKIKSINFREDSHTFDISDLEQGVYLVMVRTGDSVYSEIVLKN